MLQLAVKQQESHWSSLKGIRGSQVGQTAASSTGQSGLDNRSLASKAWEAVLGLGSISGLVLGVLLGFDKILEIAYKGVKPELTEIKSDIKVLANTLDAQLKTVDAQLKVVTSTLDTHSKKLEKLTEDMAVVKAKVLSK